MGDLDRAKKQPENQTRKEHVHDKDILLAFFCMLVLHSKEVQGRTCSLGFHSALYCRLLPGPQIDNKMKGPQTDNKIKYPDEQEMRKSLFACDRVLNTDNLNEFYMQNN